MRPLKLISSILSIILFIAINSSAQQSNQAPKDFLQTAGGKLMLNNKEFRAIGFNKYDLLQQILADYFPIELKQWTEDKRTSAGKNALKDLNKQGFRIIRVFGSPFWAPVLDELFFNKENRENYLKANDDMLTLAKKYDQKIVYTLIWHMDAFGKRKNETLKQLIADKSSASRKDLNEYISVLVKRYKDSPTIAMWEIANEGNLHADLKQQGEIGYTSQELSEFYKDISQLIRDAGDKHHIISSGDSQPRPQAWNLNDYIVRTGDWNTANWKADSFTQTKDILKLVHTQDVTSVHFYGIPNPGNKSITDYFSMTQSIGQNDAAKPLFIGEIGPRKTVDKVKLAGYNQLFSKDMVASMLKEIVANKVPLTLFWSYQIDNTAGSIMEWDIRKKGHKGSDNEIIKMIQKANNELKLP
jgi:endo-1,4-beta-mannosidase